MIRSTPYFNPAVYVYRPLATRWSIAMTADSARIESKMQYLRWYKNMRDVQSSMPSMSVDFTIGPLRVVLLPADLSHRHEQG